ncbi:MAG: hypothetical protein JNJ58_05210 [Chitinophagaceae bacterium]|nr:hypothetical protein [Chitinophagaceae bacterium]
MKNILFVFVLSLAFQVSSGQLKDKVQGLSNLNDIMQVADDYFKNQPGSSKSSSFIPWDDNEYVKYKRQEWYWKQRVMPDGSLPDAQLRYKAYSGLQTAAGSKKQRAGAWRNISQTTSPGGYNGMGRVAAVTFHPTDTNIIYVGVNKGGIWKTTTGGNSWIPLGDQLPYCSVGNIAIDPTNPNTMYITVGLNEGWWHYGLGVYKSTNGGQSWAPTTQSSNFTDQVVYYKLMMHPDSNLVLYSAQSNGLWRTSDSGATWTKIRNGQHTDIEFKPFHASTIYVAANQVYKSTDDGNNWTAVSSLTSSTDIEMSVTPADSNYIAFGTGNDKYYLSTDGANTPFVLKNSTIDDNAVIQLSYLNPQKVYCGYVKNFRSIDGGTNWGQITNWYNDGVLPEVHADNHYAAVNPLLPHYIYFCNDGGLYRLNELNNEWTDLSNGLIITEFYKIALSTQDSVFMIGGTQDNGGRKRVSPTSWGPTNGGDGMEVAINPVDDWTIFTTYWGGTMYRSYDKWVNDTYYDITADTNKGAWVTPYMLDPNSPATIIAGYADVWLSLDEGDNWNKISNNLTGNPNNKLEVLDVAPSNSDVIYTGFEQKIYYTNNLGLNWLSYTVPFASGAFENVSMVKVHPKLEDVIYVTKSGYGDHSKVYKSVNHGVTWTNISYNIPNVPANCIQIDKESDSTNVDMYLGTDVGVFYKKDLDTVWQYYGTGMPNTEVSDLEIYYATGKLRAATYGRGIWENDIVRTVTPVGTPSILSNMNVNIRTNPVDDLLMIDILGAEAGSLNISIFDRAGSVIQKQQQTMPSGNSQIKIEVSSFAPGYYITEFVNEKGYRKSIPFIKK